ncbi:MAG: hypothetical protein IBX56_19200 [Methylomicrobium sp.]|nr:hypothetical protein [Methylomicrobium sp.]
MNRKLFNWISELVVSGPDRSTTRPVSALGREVTERYRCGHLHNGKLVFTAQDKLELRRRVAEETGFDPLRERLPDDRLTVAKHHANEKLAGKPVSEDYLLLNSPDGFVRINDKQIMLYPESITAAGLFCLNSGIATVEHDVLVVVENLAIMSLCASLELPPLARRALWVYRGDSKTGSKTNACRAFVDRFGANKTVVVFSDMDPKGLEIALTMPHANYWLGPVPESWQTWLKKQEVGNHEGYDTQAMSMAYLKRLSGAGALSEPMSALIECLQNERSSCRQEHMYSHKIELGLLPIRR